MADLRDEHGNPIQLTDQYGKPVELTDEYGNPMHLTGVATTPTAKSGTAGVVAAQVAEDLSHEPPRLAPVLPHEQPEHVNPMLHPTGAAVVLGAGAALKDNPKPAAVPPRQQEQIRRSGSSSSSSSSEDDGQGGRRKKKGSLKEKLMGAFSHKDKGTADQGAQTATATTTTQSKTSTTVPGAHMPEHEKKGFMEKIKQKLPGHHHDHPGKGTN